MKKNTLLLLIIALFAMILLSPMVCAYETSEYSIDVTNNFNKEDMDGGVAFVDVENDALIGVIELETEDISEDEFYTEEVMESMYQAANDYFNTTIIPSFTTDEEGNPTGIEYMGDSGENARITTFTKNNYKCIEISRGIILKDTNIADEEEATKMYGLRYIYTLQNNKLYGVVSLFGEVTECQNIINTLTFKAPAVEEPTQEEPKAEDPKEDTTKATGKLPQTGVIVAFEVLAISLIILCSALLVVNNKRK